MSTFDTTYNLKDVLFSILFVAGDGIEKSFLAEKLEVSDNEVEKALAELEKDLSGSCGVHLIRFKNKVQLSSNPNYASYISNVLNPIREKSLTRAALETLAIIAYKQPITKGELEAVRGLNCDYAIHTLLDLKMIEPVGRKDAVGRPILYATTDNFLKRFKLNSIADLPDYDTLMESIAKLHGEEPDSYLYADNVYVDEEAAASTTESAANQETIVNAEPSQEAIAADAEEELPDFLRDLGEEDLVKIE